MFFLPQSKFKRGSFLRLISLLALFYASTLIPTSSAENLPLSSTTVEQVKEKAIELQKDLTAATKEKLQAGTETVKTTVQNGLDAAKTSIQAGVDQAQNKAQNLKTQASGALKAGQDKLQMLLDFGDEKSLNEAKDYVLSKLNGVPQSDAIADLLKRGVKGFGPWFQTAKLEAGSTAKMKMAYYSRYVNESAIAKTLIGWMNNDSDPLIQEYCAKALGYQTSEGVLDSLKEKLKQPDLSPYVKKAIESSLNLLDPPTPKSIESSLPALGQ